jgi:hypothetical protein
MTNLLRQISDLRAENQLRPANWRWKRAEMLCRPDFPRVRSLLADPRVSEAHAYLLAQRDPDVSPPEIPRRWPELHAAADIYEQSTDVRWVLEGLVVAGVTPLEISEQLPVSAATVHCYENIFFDVRDRLKFKWFVSTMLIGSTNGISFVTRDKMMKMLAYVGRETGMGEELLFGFFAHGVLSEPAREMLRTCTYDTALRATATALLNNDPMHPTYPQLVASMTAVDKNRREELDVSGGVKAEDPHQQILNALRLTVAPLPPSDVSAGQEAPAEEPRAHELFADAMRTMNADSPTGDVT